MGTTGILDYCNSLIRDSMKPRSIDWIVSNYQLEGKPFKIKRVVDESFKKGGLPCLCFIEMIAMGSCLTVSGHAFVHRPNGTSQKIYMSKEFASPCKHGHQQGLDGTHPAWVLADDSEATVVGT
jgi:hypothetical protein